MLYNITYTIQNTKYKIQTNNMILPSQEKYTIYTKSDCIYCERAKKLLSNDDPLIINCDEYLLTREIFLEKMDKLTPFPHRTFPFIFHKGKFIGGFDDTKIYYDENNSQLNFNDDEF